MKIKSVVPYRIALWSQHAVIATIIKSSLQRWAKAGYFPDPLFVRGVDVVGGRVVKNGALFLQLLAERKRWGDATQRTCFQKETHAGII